MTSQPRKSRSTIGIVSPDGSVEYHRGWRSACEAIGLSPFRLKGVVDGGGYLPDGRKLVVTNDITPSRGKGGPSPTIYNARVGVPRSLMNEAVERIGDMDTIRSLLAGFSSTGLQNYLDNLPTAPVVENVAPAENVASVVENAAGMSA